MSDRARERKPWAIARSIVGPIATPIYSAVVARRNAMFDRGEGVKRVGVPVISVGNLTVGGTGKTPMVQWLVSELLAAGRKPAIAMRGYRSRDGVSDEAEVYKVSLPGVPVLVNPDRFAAITAALKVDPRAFDCVVLDDGFQHRQLARDLDIVLIDAQAGTLTDRLLPSGDLRESVAGLARAGVVVFTHAASDHPNSLPVALRAPAIVTTAEHAWSTSTHLGVDQIASSDGQIAPRALAVCGIGRPERFFAQARARVGELRTISLPDHDAFSDATCERVVAEATAFGTDVVLMTEKDWVKAKRYAWPRSVRIVVPKVTMQIRDGQRVMSAVLAAIGGAKRAGDHAGR